MTKLPVMGRVKTRLGRDIGAVTATAFYRHAMSSVIKRLGADPRWQTIVAVAPDTAVAQAAWPVDVARVPQGGGDLGQRLDRLMRRLPPGPVVIIGTDIPSIEARHIAAAFRALGSNDAAFGPAGDGGYWLVGLARRQRVPRTFDDVRWSTEHALADTRRCLAGLRIATVATLDDVDSRVEWLSARGRSGRIVRGSRDCL